MLKKELSPSRTAPLRREQQQQPSGSAVRLRVRKKKYPPGVVILNVYDVEGHPFHYSVAKLLSLGIHHSGVQVGPKEFSFTLEGIVVTDPTPSQAHCTLTSSYIQANHVSADVLHRALNRLHYE